MPTIAAWARPAKERLRIRQEKNKPNLDQLSELIEKRILTGGLLPKSYFCKALNYYQGLAPIWCNNLPPVSQAASPAR